MVCKWSQPLRKGMGYVMNIVKSIGSKWCLPFLRKQFFWVIWLWGPGTGPIGFVSKIAMRVVMRNMYWSRPRANFGARARAWGPLAHCREDYWATLKVFIYLSFLSLNDPDFSHTYLNCFPFNVNIVFHLFAQIPWTADFNIISVLTQKPIIFDISDSIYASRDTIWNQTRQNSMLVPDPQKQV